MAEIRHLTRAPISEALIDIRTENPPGVRPESFEIVKDRFKDTYPKVEEQRRFAAQFEIKPGGPLAGTASTGDLFGYVFKTADGLNIGQFRRDGFTFNRLSPYPGWATFEPEALRLWEVYREIAAPERVSRLGVRFINRLQLPPDGALDDFLEVVPPGFPGAPTVINGYLLRISVSSNDDREMASIVQSLEFTPGTEGPTLLLDIDAYRESGIGLAAADLEPVLQRLRTMKNEIFFGSLTDQTVQKYQ